MVNKGNSGSTLSWFHGPLCPWYQPLFKGDLEISKGRGVHLVFNLQPRAVREWAHLVSQVNSNFFYAKAKFFLAELAHTGQYSNKDLDVYVKRFH